MTRLTCPNTKQRHPSSRRWYLNLKNYQPSTVPMLLLLLAKLQINPSWTSHCDQTAGWSNTGTIWPVSILSVVPERDGSSPLPFSHRINYIPWKQIDSASWSENKCSAFFCWGCFLPGQLLNRLILRPHHHYIQQKEKQWEHMNLKKTKTICIGRAERGWWVGTKLIFHSCWKLHKIRCSAEAVRM